MTPTKSRLCTGVARTLFVAVLFARQNYWYRVRAGAGFLISPFSNVVKVKTR